MNTPNKHFREYDNLVAAELAAFIAQFTASGRPDHIKAMDALRDCRMRAYDNLSDLEVTLPIIDTQVEALHGYLTGVFGAVPEIFRLTKSPKATPGMLTALSLMLSGYAKRWSWQSQLSLLCHDAALYNVCVAAGEWHKVTKAVKDSSLQTSLNSGSGAKYSHAAIQEGFRIKRLDPLNSFWDTTCDAAEVASSGDFIGYHELLTTQRLDTFLRTKCQPTFWQWRLKFLLQSNDAGEAYGGNGGINYYQLHESRPGTPKTSTKAPTPSYADLWGAVDTQQRKFPNRIHTLTRMCWRGVPADLDLPVPQRTVPQMLQLFILNGRFLIGYEVITNAHGNFPFLACIPSDRGQGASSKSLPEKLEPLQRVSSTLISQDIASSRKVVAGQKLANKNAIGGSIASSDPIIWVGNIPPGQPLRSVYEDVSHIDQALGSRTQQAMGLVQWANDVAGQNAVFQGNFVKGNKTDEQFAATLRGASQRQLLYAIGIHNGIIEPLGDMLLSDMRQFVVNLEAWDSAQGEMISLPREAWVNTPVSFDLSDGLRQALNAAATSVLSEGMQLASQNPALGGELKLGELFAHVMSNMGAHGLEVFTKTAADRQAELQQQMQMFAAQQAVQSTGKVAENAAAQQQGPGSAPGTAGG